MASPPARMDGCIHACMHAWGPKKGEDGEKGCSKLSYKAYKAVFFLATGAICLLHGILIRPT